jgi:hypothetical protein
MVDGGVYSIGGCKRHYRRNDGNELQSNTGVYVCDNGTRRDFGRRFARFAQAINMSENLKNFFVIIICLALGLICCFGCQSWQQTPRGQCVEEHYGANGLCAQTSKALRLLSVMMAEHGLPDVRNANVWWYAGSCVEVIEQPGHHWSDSTSFCLAGDASGCDLDVSPQAGGISDSTLPHEALHCSLWLRDGNADGGHTGPFWALPEGEWAARLRAAGL